MRTQHTLPGATLVTVASAGILLGISACSTTTEASSQESGSTTAGQSTAGASSEPATDAAASDGRQTTGNTSSDGDDSAASTKENTPTLVGYEVQAPDDAETKSVDEYEERVVFHFSGANSGENLPTPSISYVAGYPHKSGSGNEVEMNGQLFLQASFDGSGAAADVPKSRQPQNPIVSEVRYLGGFEKTQNLGVGISSCHGAPEKSPYDVATSGDDIILTIEPASCGRS